MHTTFKIYPHLLQDNHYLNQDVQVLHLQGLEAGAPQHAHFQEGYPDHEQLRDGHLRQGCERGFEAVQDEQDPDSEQPRCAVRGPPGASR